MMCMVYVILSHVFGCVCMQLCVFRTACRSPFFCIVFLHC